MMTTDELTKEIERLRAELEAIVKWRDNPTNMSNARLSMRIQMAEKGGNWSKLGPELAEELYAYGAREEALQADLARERQNREMAEKSILWHEGVIANTIKVARLDRERSRETLRKIEDCGCPEEEWGRLCEPENSDQCGSCIARAVLEQDSCAKKVNGDAG